MNLYRRFKRLNFWNKLGVVGSIASLIGLAVAFVSFNGDSSKKQDNQQRPPQFTSGNQSPAVITSGNVTIIYKDVIPSPALPVSSEFDSTYKMAVSFKAAEDWRKAAELFQSIYSAKPDYPTLAMNFSICLSKLGKDEEAFTVMLSIPNTEHYQFLNFNKGLTLFKMKRYSKASEYLKLSMADYKKNDCRYWTARALLITSQYGLSSSLMELIKETNKFMSVVSSDVRWIYDHQSNGSLVCEVDADEVQGEILSRKNAAFYLLKAISTETAQLERFDEALSFALKALDQLEGPTEGCPLEIDDVSYKDFLAYVSFILSRSPDRAKFTSAVDGIMDKIERHNKAIHQAVIAELAMLIRLFYGTSSDMFQVKNGEFKVTYSANTTDNKGLKLLSFESPDYLFGNGSLDLNGVKEYRFERSVILAPKDRLKVKPYLRYNAYDMSGNVSRIGLVPTIAAVK